MACKLRDVSSWTYRPAAALLPFLYETQTIQRRSFNASRPPQDDNAKQSGLKIRSTDSTKPTFESLLDPSGWEQFQIKREPRSRDSKQRERYPTDRNAFRKHISRDARRYQAPRPEPPPPRTTSDENLPFEGLDADILIGNDRDFDPDTAPRHRDTTITDLERTAFSRLFDKLAGRTTPSSTSKKPSTPSQEELNITSLLSETSNDLSTADALDLDRILDEDLRNRPFSSPSSSSKISQYPAALQDMALLAHAERRHREVQQATSRAPAPTKTTTTATSPGEGRRMATAQAVASEMRSARTDTEIWRIHTEQVLEKVRALRLDDPSASQADHAYTSSQLYPALTLLALRLLLRRTSYTPLPFALLPALHALGPSGHALLGSGSLYNELLVCTWQRTGSLARVNALLREMDSMGLAMGQRTYAQLGRIVRYREEALRGAYGEGVRAWEGMIGRTREADELKGWMEVCWRWAEEEAREKARKREWEEMVRREEDGEDEENERYGASAAVS